MGERAISPMGHVRMMAAVQPFISGAISKTVNMPESATVEEIEKIYFQAWKWASRPSRSTGTTARSVSRCRTRRRRRRTPRRRSPPRVAGPGRAIRKRLPRQRESVTTSFTVAGADGYITAGSYPGDGLGEVFVKLGKQGSTLAGVMDAFSIAVSVALQYGVPLETYVQKFTNMRFEPAGMTDDPDIRMAQSMMDYIFRRLALDYLSFETRSSLGIHTTTERERQLETGSYGPADADDESEPRRPRSSRPGDDAGPGRGRRTGTRGGALLGRADGHAAGPRG